MVTVGRNEPCPCGSGRRYKECHGAIGGAAATGPAAPADAAWLAQTMRAALRAQRRGEGDEAGRLYHQVLAADPSNFDATHMLGVVEYELGHHESALVLIKQAIELRPDLGVPRHNLRLLESMPLVETEICREVLPRLAPRVNLGYDPAALASADAVHIVAGDAWGAQERAALTLVLAACKCVRPTLWGEAPGEPVAGMATSELTAGHHPRGGSLVMVGTARSQASWLAAMRAEYALLIVTRDTPCAIIDRVDELAAAGHDRPGLLCATPELADRLKLPREASLPQREAVARVDS